MESGLATTVTEGKQAASTTSQKSRTDAGWNHLVRSVPLALLDALLLVGIAFLAYYLGDRAALFGDSGLQDGASRVASSATLIVASLGFLWLVRSRNESASATRGFTWARVAGAVSFASMLTALGWLVFSPDAFDQLHAALVWALAILLLPAGELAARKAFEAIRSRSSHHMPVIIVGSDTSAAIARQRFERDARRYQLVGTLDLSNGNGHDSQDVSGMLDLGAHAKRNGGVLVATPADKYANIESLVASHALADAGRVKVSFYPHLNGAGAEAISWQPKQFSWMYEKLKRGIDLAIAVTSLTLASPLILMLAALIKLDSRGPVFFSQTRVGRGGQLFKMHKFRSMCNDAEKMLDKLADKNEAAGQMFKIADDPRVTRVGRVIRRLSLDEIPQLFNVVQGSMSIIGPRPPLPHEVKEYEPRHFRRFEATPGITGLWQVSRGAEISFDEMVSLDIEYIDKWSLWKDIRILVKTVPAMLRGQGAY